MTNNKDMNNQAITNVEFKVMHKVPGRIRLEIPLLKSDDRYKSVLKKLLKSMEEVKGVRINRVASSLVVQYDYQTISEGELDLKLERAIAAAKNPYVAEQLKTVSSYQAIQLTEYESKQFAEIQEWLDENPSWLEELFGHILIAGKELLNWIIPESIFAKIGATCNAVTANWEKDWWELKSQASVEDYHQLRHGKLEKCDRLTAQVINRSLAKATGEGGFSGITEIFGEVINDTLVVTLGLRTIHQIGLCYGYAPDNPTEKAFAWGIFNLAVAQTESEQEEARKKIQNLRWRIEGQKLEKETLKQSLEEDINDLLVDSVIERVLSELAEETAGGIIPVLSIFLSLSADDSMISEVSTAAKREFQLRWLLDNQKIACVDTVNQEAT